ncbi:MAG: tetratricopeptide repeat-containing serine protease family protein [Candidatus Poribacteria bacterium]|nr:tetratricopeptide repeat-containing serine protease family protein [Candidatus Poribacteria bacterium]
MRILAIGITFCLVFYTVCVSDEKGFDAILRSDAGEKALRLIENRDQNDYDAGIAAYKRGHYSVALSNFESRAMEDDPVAQFCLGFMYKNHSKIAAMDRSFTETAREAICRKETKKWYTKAADQGYLPAQNDLGVMYVSFYEESDRENFQELEMAKEWFQKAAGQDYPPAQFNLGIITEHENAVFALEWYTKAAEQEYPPAQDHLGSLYYHGDSVEQNPISAVKWFRAAAEQGYPPAQHNLGICYEKGFGVNKNLEHAFRWWKKAAEQGNANGQFAIALSYQLGDAVDKNDKEALKWYEKAAKQDHIDAQNNLAKMYNDYALKLKKDEEKDYSEEGSKYYFEMANRWYLRASQNGNPTAQWNIGRRFEERKDKVEEGKDKVSQDFVEAYYWYSLALKNKAGLKGSTVKVSDVNKARERIRKSLEDDKELINQIQQQVDNWKPKQLVASGTGFYVDKNHILTNAHVVVWEEKPGNYRFYDEFHIPYRRVVLFKKNIDLELDLALLYDEHRKTDESGNVFANFRLKDIEVGEKIVSFGYPQGDRLSFKGNLTDGIVSGLSYPITAPKPAIGFQHTAPTQRGNSGGPILDVAGYVLGVSVFTLSDFDLLEGMGADSPEVINLAQNMNFAIGSDAVKNFLFKRFPTVPLPFHREELDAPVKKVSGDPTRSEDLYKAIALEKIRAKAEKFTVPVLCFKNKKREPMSVEEIGIYGLKE